MSVGDLTTAGYTLKDDEPGLYTWKLTMPPDGKRDMALVFTVRHPSSMTLASMR